MPYKETKKELLFSIGRKDLRVEFFSGTGAGGQYRNKHQNCVRIHHTASRAIATGQSYRERPANIKEAMNSLVESPIFKVWQAQKINETISGKTVEQIVDEQMQPQYLRIEVKSDNGKWIEEEMRNV